MEIQLPSITAIHASFTHAHTLEGAEKAIVAVCSEAIRLSKPTKTRIPSRVAPSIRSRLRLFNMKNRTITLTVPASRDDVFSFLAQIENLPLWASQYCRELRRVGSHWKIRTRHEELFVALVADARLGVIDLFTGECLDEMALTPIRVVSVAHGCAVTMTLFQAADESVESYEQRYQAWLIDGRVLTHRFGGGEVHGLPSAAALLYPGIVTSRFYETWDFYTEHFGFRTLRENSGYVHLIHASGAQLRIIHEELNDQFPALVSATDGRGFWLNLPSADADADYVHMIAAGVNVVSPPENTPWGEREFVVQDPNGILIFVAHGRQVTAEAELMIAR
jgi:uncharacterized glyoxalase superfamily protein PhnB